MDGSGAPGGDAPRNHLTEAIDQDLATGRFEHVLTRFAPQPNAYLHLGHAVSIFMTYGMAERYGGLYNLRFDDTNPAKEKAEYVQAIREDIRWLGYDWSGREFYASDYFGKLYEWACELIRKGKAYVCDLSDAEVTEYRGAAAFAADGSRKTPPGRPSPWRDRGVEENLDLFRRMRSGEFPDRARTLRARIDMAHDLLILRDPIMYRIVRAAHHRTGTEWCIYPTYDWAHGQSDSLEGVTHSICAMEFRHHRPLYDWFIAELGIHHPRQIEYPRMRLSHTVTSKRLLVPLVERGYVSGWDDPRMPTLRGLRRRGVPAEVIRDFASRLPVVDGKLVTPVDVAYFEHCIREQLNLSCPRAMAVLEPLRLVLEGPVPDGVEAINNPEDPAAGTRRLPLSRELYVEREDFMAEPAPGFRRLAPGRVARLRYAFPVRCTGATKDASGAVTEIRCTLLPETEGRAAKATLHWVSAPDSVAAEVRLYETLFATENPLEGAEGESWLEHWNPASLTVLGEGRVEPALAEAPVGYRCQFERKGYFCVDPDSRPGRPVFNRIVPLKDAWERAKRAAHARSACRAPRSASRGA